MVQVVPSHCSASARLPLRPTAMQEVDVEHDTPSSIPEALGVVAMVQLVPSQVSTSGVGWVDAGVLCPTAVHCAALVHDTEKRSLYSAGLGLGMADQVSFVTFSSSTNVSRWSAVVFAEPTAMQTDELGQATSLRVLKINEMAPVAGANVHWKTPGKRIAPMASPEACPK